MKKKILGLSLFFVIVILFYLSKDILTLEYIKEKQQTLLVFIENNMFFSMTIYFVFYIFITALSIPGATLITLLAAALFGFWNSLIIVSFASTIGATLAFLVSRYLLRDWCKKNFKEKSVIINKGMEKEGSFYLFSLRLIPIMPFFLINLLFGLTNIKTKTYYWISQLGMLPGTAVYLNAGTQLSKIETLSGIISTEIMLSFILLGLFPWFSKKTMQFYKRKKALT